MSTELEAFFTAMGHDADGLPAAAPGTVRRLGGRRRRRVAVIAAVTVFFLVGTVAIAIGAGLPERPPRPAVPPTGTPTAVAPSGTFAAVAPTTFQKLAPVGTTISVDKSQSRGGNVVTAGDRAFVCWQSESGQTSVVAVDLRTGRVAWGPVHIGDFADVTAVFWHPRYVLVMGRNDNQAKPDGAMFALDPGTGKVLLHVDVDNFEADDLLFGASTLVITSRVDERTRGYDLATGRLSWTLPDPASRIVTNVPVGTTAGPPPESQRGEFGDARVAADRFVQLTADGTLILRDLATGAETARRTGAVSAVDPADTGQGQDSVLAVDTVLYLINRDHRNVVRVMDLSGKSAATNLYTAERGVRLGSLDWCGPTQICVGESRGAGVNSTAGLDTRTGKVRWRQDGHAIGVRVVNGQVLLSIPTRADDYRSAVIDTAGRQLLTEQAQAGTANWIDGNALLVLPARQDGPATAVSGVSPLNGSPVPLGTIAVQDVRGCGWSRTHLLCVTTTGIKVWRFAV